MKLRSYLLLLLLCGTVSVASAQNTSQKTITAIRDSLAKLQQLPSRYFNKVTAKADRLNHRLTKKTAGALRKLQKQEEKINGRLTKIDSLAAHNLFSLSIDSLSHLRNLIKGKLSGITGRVPGGQYIPYLDSLGTALKFLDKYSSRLNQIKDIQQKLQGSLGSVQQVEGRLKQLQGIQQYIGQREQAISRALNNPALAVGKYGARLGKYLQKYKKEAYSYKAQIANYKEIWQHPDQVEAKAMEMLNKLPVFTKFMQKHSVIAGLFRIPSNYGSAGSVAGLQTRSMVERELQQRIRQAGPDGRQQIKEQMQQAKQQLQELQSKLGGAGSSAAQIPDLKPDDLKSKTLFQRLSYGTDLQFEKATGWFPTTSDIAVQVGYKFSKKGAAGIGTSFKLGWGNIHKIRFTAQGLGLRSYLNWQIKGTFYVAGGYEVTWNTTVPDIPALEKWNGWTRSALLGIQRKYKISDKLSGNMMLLFDFLYRQHVPQTQPVVFRVGYNF